MKNIILIMMGTLSLFGFEVNTHQAITRCALTQECSTQGGVSNLENFVKHTELNSTLPIYKNEDYEKYDSKYIDYVGQDKTGFKDWQIQITPNYHGMIEAGSVLEDSVYHNHSNSGDGRFNNHSFMLCSLIVELYVK
jgi:hypothetical protein